MSIETQLHAKPMRTPEEARLAAPGHASNPPAAARDGAAPPGLRRERHYTRPGTDPFDGVEWSTRKSVIKEPDGTIVFKVDKAEVPREWSQLATDIIVSK